VELLAAEAGITDQLVLMVALAELMVEQVELLVPGLGEGMPILHQGEALGTLGAQELA
jgi:hypothetical protein